MNDDKNLKTEAIGTSIPTVDITIGPNMFGRMSDIKNTPSHVLAEFVDNALQSYRDNKDKLEQIDPDYHLKVEISFEWKEDKADSIIHIKDNAAGINEQQYYEAFKLANTPDNNQGLNEFGMGMKTAALWLGELWSLKTTALGDAIQRSTSFDLNKVMTNSLQALPIFTKPASENEHYTQVDITNLTPNAPTSKSIQRIKDELSSIYRKSLRSHEMEIVVNGESLVFIDSPVLQAPFARTPKGPVLTWRKDIDFKFGKYKAKGFIGILRDINATKNGFVLLRRGRVVIGAEDGFRYFPKSLCGSAGNFRYKRLFGELELEGFDVSFNKNDLKDRENLDALMDALKSVIHTRDFDLYTQAEEYRLDVRTKQVNKIVRGHNTSKSKSEEVVSISTTKSDPPKGSLETAPQPTLQFEPETEEPVVMGEYDDYFKVDGVQYRLNVQFVTSGSDLIWVDTSQKKDNIVICKINANHPYFNILGKVDKPTIALLKTMAMAKFTTKEKGNDTTAEMFDFFNEYIKSTKV